MSDNTDSTAPTRTDLAEDRTVLANERTFASWLRTGMACVAVGLGFRALLRSFEPVWIAKSVASLFILAGVMVVWFAFRRACDVHRRLDNHQVRTISMRHMGWISATLIVASLALMVVLWFLA